MRYVAPIAAAALLLGVCADKAAAQACSPVNPLSPFDSLADDCAIQALLDQGGDIALQAGGQGYLIEQGLRLKVAGTQLHSNAAGQYAKLVAGSQLSGMMLRNYLDQPVNNFSLYNLIIDGNKWGRYSNYPLNCNVPNGGKRERGISISVKGSGFSVHDVSFDNAQCGSAFEASGSNFYIYNNTVANSGLEDGSVGGVATPFADGITLGECINSNVTGNRVLNATDVAIVVGLGTTQNCTVDGDVVPRNVGSLK